MPLINVRSQFLRCLVTFKKSIIFIVLLVFNDLQFIICVENLFAYYGAWYCVLKQWKKGILVSSNGMGDNVLLSHACLLFVIFLVTLCDTHTHSMYLSVSYHMFVELTVICWMRGWKLLFYAFRLITLSLKNQIENIGSKKHKKIELLVRVVFFL